jgi:hypothetical protein
LPFSPEGIVKRGAKENPLGFTREEIHHEIAREIFYRMANGEAVTTMCQEPQYPSYSIFIAWTMDDPDLFQEYSQARQIQADFYADDIVAIADNETNPALAKNRMDARKWHASKIAPRKYGDRILNELTGQVDSKVRIDFSSLPREARETLRQALIEQMKGNQKTVEGIPYKVVGK